MSRPFPKFGYNPVTGEWNDSLTGEFMWSNVNLSEAVPDVMTPSTWSLWWIFHYETNPIVLSKTYPFCGNICGRPYFNLSLLYSVYQAVLRDAREQLQGDLLGSTPADVGIPTLPLTAFHVYRTVLPGTVKARWQMMRCRKDMARFLETAPRWCRQTRNAILTWKEPSSLLAGWVETIKPAIEQACNMLRTVTALLTGPATRLRHDLAARAGDIDANTILSNFSGTSGGLTSLGPLLGLAQITKNALSKDAYLELYGHRGPHEMELYLPGPDEDPDWIEKQLAHFSGLPVDVETLLANRHAQQGAAWRSFASRFPQEVSATRQRLETVAAAAQNREAVRSEVTRMARVLRFFLLQAGAVTGMGEDIFFLSLDELVEVLGGDRSPIAHLPSRRTAYQRYCALPAYPAVIVGHFDPYEWAADSNRRSDFFDARQKGASATSRVIKGIPGASGCVEGVVRRIDRMEDAHQVLPGEILVTTITNVGWTPIFPRLAAIVTDIGAPLSHAAIVAREIGIVAVVGCGNATMLLKTGDRVRVNGGSGTVEILLPASPAL